MTHLVSLTLFKKTVKCTTFDQKYDDCMLVKVPPKALRRGIHAFDEAFDTPPLNIEPILVDRCLINDD